MKIAFKMKLNPGSEAEYQRRHSPIWQELKEVLLDKGVKSYSIFLDRPSGDLFAYAEIEDWAQWQSVAQDPICGKWWDYMAPLMVVNEDNSPRSQDLEQVFDINS